MKYLDLLYDCSSYSGVLPLYIAAQNAIVIFRRIWEDRLTFEYFEASLPAEEVMKVSKKIQVQFPTNPRLLLAWQQDVTDSLANLLSYLSVDRDEALKNPTGILRRSSPKASSSRFISEAIAGLVRGSQPSDNRPFSTTYITKRLDDQVLGKSIERPWRRSPLWLLARVALQTTLAEAQISDGYGYKAFQAFFLAHVIRKAGNSHPEILTNDTLWFMNAKLARRLVKLSTFVEDESNKVLREAGYTVEFVSEYLGERWAEVKEAWASRVQWPEFNPALLEHCTVITFSKSQDYLRGVVGRQHALSQTVTSFDRGEVDRNLAATCAPRTANSPYQLPSSLVSKELSIALYDFENWVHHHLQEWVDLPRSEEDCLKLGLMINEYRDKASIKYKENPERMSLMYLCIFELWVALDRLVSGWCRLILEYSPEIPLSSLDPLLLPYHYQLERLHRVHEYLKERHRRAKRHGSRSVFKDISAADSFANEFFDLEQATDLRVLERSIRREARQKRDAKLVELEHLNKQHRKLEKRSGALECQCLEQILANGSSQQSEEIDCERCNLRTRASQLQISPIEELLPDDAESARPIVFELECPQPFAIWRDVVRGILQVGRDRDQIYSKSIHPLSKYAPLKKFLTSSYSNQRIQLASSVRPLASNRKRKVSIPATEDQVIIGCGGRFSLYDSFTHGWVMAMNAPKLGESCTLKLDGVYKPLQIFLDTTAHTSNQVIAFQHACPAALSIDEFLAFGHLRAGNWLQWRNIIRALRTQSLTFSESSVYFLILQAIWQAGPEGNEGVYRRAHGDLLDEDFCTQALDELLVVVDTIGENWMQALLLAAVVALVARIHNLTPSKSLKQQAVTILEKVRSVAGEWMESLQGACVSQESIKAQSRHALITVAFVLRATFDIERSANVFQSEEEVTQYLYAGTFISDIPSQDLSHGARLLAYRDHTLALTLSHYVSSMCRKSSNILHNVISRRWSLYRAGSDWVPLSAPADRWWVSTTQGGNKVNSRVIHLNILSGGFLIDGKAFDRLPLDYASHPTYCALFGSEVRPFNLL
jgi:hypothetical protein